MNNKKKITVRKLVTLAILAGLGIPLMYISIGPVPAAPWLKFDLSDIVVYVAAVIYGPLAATLVALIKSIADFFLKGSETGIPINQMIAFVSSLAYMFPFYYTMLFLKKIIKNRKLGGQLMVRIVPVIIGTLSLTVVLTFLNYVWFTPLYLELLGIDLPQPFFNYVVSIYGPFNFAKGAALSGIFVLLSYRLEELASYLNSKDNEVNPLLINQIQENYHNIK